MKSGELILFNESLFLTNTLPYKETQDIIVLIEERRLFYVGITRPKRLLYLISSQELHSPFLDEIDQAYLVKNGI